MLANVAKWTGDQFGWGKLIRQENKVAILIQINSYTKISTLYMNNLEELLLNKSAYYLQNRLLLILLDIKWTAKFQCWSLHWAKWVSLLHFGRIYSYLFMLAHVCTWKCKCTFSGQIWVSHFFYHSLSCS